MCTTCTSDNYGGAQSRFPSPHVNRYFKVDFSVLWSFDYSVRRQERDLKAAGLPLLLHRGVTDRWERFEELLEEARSTRDYDVTLAINQMVDYLLSENGAQIRQQLSVQLVDQVDQLCLLYTSPSPRDGLLSRMPSSA